MKKYSVFLCVMLLVFAAAVSVQAYPIDPTGSSPVFSPPQKELPYIDGSVWTTWNNGYIGGTADLYDEGWAQSDQPGQDTFDNVNAIIQFYNSYNASSLPLIEGDGQEVEWNGEDRSGTVDVSGWQYISLKWDGVFGLWDVNDIDSFDYDGLLHGLSHYRTWNSIPEPATMLLLGSGLILMAGFGRKRLKI